MIDSEGQSPNDGSQPGTPNYSYQFGDSFQQHMLEYWAQAPRGRSESLMQAARDMQMAENWRAQAGTWERLGNELGSVLESGKDQWLRDVLYSYPKGREFFGQFYVISDIEWDSIKPRCPKKCRDQCADRQKQAYAYEWAAEAAAAASNAGDAARLFRRAGWAWEKTTHYMASGQEGSIEVDRYRRAAKCYAEASANASRTSRYSTRQMIVYRRWCPACLRDKKREDKCEHDDHMAVLDRHPDTPATDIERLHRCWLIIAKSQEGRRASDKVTKGNDGAPRDNSERGHWRAFEEGRQQLSEIQGRLASEGARKEAREVYREQRKYITDYYVAVKDWRWVPLRVLRLLSHNGSSPGRLLTSLATLYLVILPTAWLGYWMATAPPVPLGQKLGPLPLEAVIFSLSNIVNLSNGHFLVTSSTGTLLQALQGLSGYFALVRILYVAQRSYAA